jgi:hypothetical protein
MVKYPHNTKPETPTNGIVVCFFPVFSLKSHHIRDIIIDNNKNRRYGLRLIIGVNAHKYNASPIPKYSSNNALFFFPLINK